MVDKGNYPKMAASFRLVNYYNLPRIVYDTQITIFRWGYKPTYNWGGTTLCK